MPMNLAVFVGLRAIFESLQAEIRIQIISPSSEPQTHMSCHHHLQQIGEFLKAAQSLARRHSRSLSHFEICHVSLTAEKELTMKVMSQPLLTLALTVAISSQCAGAAAADQCAAVHANMLGSECGTSCKQYEACMKPNTTALASPCKLECFQTLQIEGGLKTQVFKLLVPFGAWKSPQESANKIVFEPFSVTSATTAKKNNEFKKIGALKLPDALTKVYVLTYLSGT